MNTERRSDRAPHRSPRRARRPPPSNGRASWTAHRPRDSLRLIRRASGPPVDHRHRGGEQALRRRGSRTCVTSRTASSASGRPEVEAQRRTTVCNHAVLATRHLVDERDQRDLDLCSTSVGCPPRAGLRSTAAGDAPAPAADRGLQQRRGRPDARPSMQTSSDSSSRATCPTVLIPLLRSLSAVTRPLPEPLHWGAWRNVSSRDGGTTRSPFGFATRSPLWRGTSSSPRRR